MFRVLCLAAVGVALSMTAAEDAAAQGMRRRGMRARMMRRHQMMMPAPRMRQRMTKSTEAPSGWQAVSPSRQPLHSTAPSVVRGPWQNVPEQVIPQGSPVVQGSPSAGGRVLQNGKTLTLNGGKLPKGGEWIEEGANQIGAEIAGQAGAVLIQSVAEGLLRGLLP